MNRTMQVLPALRVPLKWLWLAVPAGAGLALVFLAAPLPERRWWTGLACIAGGVAGYFALREGGHALFAGGASTGILMVVSLVLIFAEVPIVYALVIGSFAGLTPLPPLMLVTITQTMSGALNSFTLLAIPFFILAAAIMNAGGITVRIVDLAVALVGHFRGGLGQANIVTNVMLAGVSGSSTADASATAKLLVPQMERHGYDRAFGCALTAAASTLANMIPPGLGLIIYAALASVSVGALFVGDDPARPDGGGGAVAGGLGRVHAARLWRRGREGDGCHAVASAEDGAARALPAGPDRRRRPLRRVHRDGGGGHRLRLRAGLRGASSIAG